MPESRIFEDILSVQFPLGRDVGQLARHVEKEVDPLTVAGIHETLQPRAVLGSHIRVRLVRRPLLMKADGSHPLGGQPLEMSRHEGRLPGRATAEPGGDEPDKGADLTGGGRTGLAILVEMVEQQRARVGLERLAPDGGSTRHVEDANLVDGCGRRAPADLDQGAGRRRGQETRIRDLGERLAVSIDTDGLAPCHCQVVPLSGLPVVGGTEIEQYLAFLAGPGHRALD